ncbi:MAG TPA: hypothetical protein VIT45_08280 [Allosphingosinicella sp.]
MRKALTLGWSALAGALLSGGTFACIWLVGQTVMEGSFDLFLILAGGGGATILFSLIALPITSTLAILCRFRAIQTFGSAILAGGIGLTAATLTFALLLPGRPDPPDPVVDNLVILTGSAFLAGCIGGWVVSTFSRIREIEVE